MDNKNVFASNLKKYMELNDKTRQEICADLGFNYYTFSDWVNAKKYPRMDKVELLAEYFGIKKSDLIEEKDSKGSILNIPGIMPLPKTYTVPLLGNIACGDPILAEQNIADWVPVPDSVKNADFALTCQGDSMINARIFDGDIVYIRQQSDVDDGDIAAVLIGEEATLKRVYKMPSRLQLRAENPSFPPINLEGEDLENVRILGKAVAFTSAVR